MSTLLVYLWTAMILKLSASFSNIVFQHIKILMTLPSTGAAFECLMGSSSITEYLASVPAESRLAAVASLESVLAKLSQFPDGSERRKWLLERYKELVDAESETAAPVVTSVVVPPSTGSKSDLTPLRAAFDKLHKRSRTTPSSNIIEDTVVVKKYGSKLDMASLMDEMDVVMAYLIDACGRISDSQSQLFIKDIENLASRLAVPVQELFNRRFTLNAKQGYLKIDVMLVRAITFHRYQVAKALVVAGADILLTTRGECSCLHAAIKNGSEEMVGFLVDHALAQGLTQIKDLVNESGQTPMQFVKKQSLKDLLAKLY